MSSNTGTMLTFLDLPLSVRERIYRYTLFKRRIFVRPFVSMTYLKDPSRKRTYDAPTLSLLRTSKQIYEEALPIFLSENTFTIIQVDLLAAARIEYPQVFQNLKLIRKVELIFDARDYLYLANFITSYAPRIRAEIDINARGLRRKRGVLERLDGMYFDFDVESEQSPSPSPSTSVSPSQSPRHVSFEEEQEAHDRHVENMNEYLWGRTMTFVRQTFKLTHLYVDLRKCTCVGGCCRLADEVMAWGWFYVWLHGLPNEVQVRGASRKEMDAIASAFDKQWFHQGLEREEIYDLERVERRQGLRRYTDMLKAVHRGILEHNLCETEI